MNELIRVYSKKVLFLLLVGVILNAGLFILSCNGEKDITLTGDKLDTYINDYFSFLNKTSENSEIMSDINIYSSGFAADNIEKTQSMYKNLQGITLRKADNRGIVQFLQYTLSDVFFITFLMSISVGMIREKKKGLAGLVRSTYNGRAQLFFKRVLILAFSSGIAVFLLYGGNYIGMVACYGKYDLSVSIQSLPEFMNCPYGITVGGFILRMLIIKAVVGFAVALGFFVVISISGTAAAYIITAVFTAAELLLYSLIAPVSGLRILKYMNVFSAFRVADYYSGCNFINIFGKAASPLICTGVALSIFILSFLTAGYFVCSKMYVSNTESKNVLYDKIAILLDKISFQRTLSGWELYKLLIKQGGIIFMGIAFGLALWTSMKYNYLNKENINEIEWYKKYRGVITSESVANAGSDLTLLNKQTDYWRKRIDEIQSVEKINYNSLANAQNSLEKAVSRYEGLLPVEKNMREGYEYTLRTGNEIMLIKPSVYELLLVRDKNTSSLASLFIIIGIIGSVSGIYAYDRQNNMRRTIRSSYRGRKRFTAAKMISVLTICILICVSVHLIQFVQIGKLFRYNDMEAPVQSLPFMRNFTPYISISQYFVLLFIVRCAAACVVGIICMLVSRFSPDTYFAIGISAFTLTVPAVFTELIPAARTVNAIYLISGQYLR